MAVSPLSRNDRSSTCFDARVPLETGAFGLHALFEGWDDCVSFSCSLSHLLLLSYDTRGVIYTVKLEETC
jgi:hypothetical protein